MAAPQGYAQLAAELRGRITRGELRPGDRLPSETDLMHTYGLARETVRRAVRRLADEGLVDVRHGYGTRVAQPPQRVELPAERGTLIFARPATADERAEHGLPAGWPVLVVREVASGLESQYPAERYAVRIPD